MGRGLGATEDLGLAVGVAVAVGVGVEVGFGVEVGVGIAVGVVVAVGVGVGCPIHASFVSALAKLVEPSKPPAAINFPLMAVPDTSERATFMSGAVDQVSLAGS